MSVSIKQYYKTQPTQEAQERRVVEQAMLDAMKALAAKLDADVGVTDTDYAATLAAIITD